MNEDTKSRSDSSGLIHYLGETHVGVAFPCLCGFVTRSRTVPKDQFLGILQWLTKYQSILRSTSTRLRAFWPFRYNPTERFSAAEDSEVRDNKDYKQRSPQHGRRHSRSLRNKLEQLHWHNFNECQRGMSEDIILSTSWTTGYCPWQWEWKHGSCRAPHEQGCVNAYVLHQEMSWEVMQTPKRRLPISGDRK